VGRGYVGVLSVEMHLPTAASLKDKRREVRRLKAGLENRLSFSVAEVGEHDLWQRATLSAAIVTREAGEAERLVDQALAWLDTDPELQMVGRRRAVIAVDEEWPA
jgi:uncharacterized protein